MPILPHFDLPFRMEPDATGRPRAVVVEQDSEREITNCVEAILRTPAGWRDDLPEFGVTDPEFATTSPVDGFSAAVEQFEPRAAVAFTDTVDTVDAAVRRITATTHKAT